MRAFVGVALTPEIRDVLGEASSIIGGADSRWQNARWVPRQNLHITLQFLGEITDETAGHLADMLLTELADAASTSVTLDAIDAIPRADRARMLWAHFSEKDGGLAAIASRVIAASATIGITPEKRPFTAHATLARVKRPGPIDPAALAAAEAHIESALGQRTVMSVGQATLYQSTLTRTGAVYEELAIVPVGPSR